ncbi:MAG: GNAT family N-acetyltransferase [Flavobacteriales bacterium]
MREPTENGSRSTELRLSLHDSIHLIRRADWDVVAADASLYLSYDYLVALEDVMSATMTFRYAIFHDRQYKPVGIAGFQILDFEDNGSTQGVAMCKLGAGIGARIIKEMKARSLVCGNVFNCGEHGAHFAKGIGLEQQLAALETAMENLRADERLQPKVSLLAFKEFWPERRDATAVLLDKGYHQLATDVNMVMDLDPTWKDLAGYQDALTSKARTRIKSILRRSAALGIRELPADEIRRRVPAIQGLFKGVLERSPFIFGRLDVRVYAEWKELLGDRLMFRGFFLNDELVGFSSSFALGNTLDAQFVGFDHTHNQQHGIYLRMLVDLLDRALERGSRRINFGRTSEQAKSTIGAVPVQMLVYMKHRNRVANHLIGPFIRKVKPDEFVVRSPFRKEAPMKQHTTMLARA